MKWFFILIIIPFCISKSISQSEQADTIDFYLNKGKISKNSGDYREALDYYQKAEAILKEIYELNETVTSKYIDCLRSIGHVYFKYYEEFDTALTYFVKALQIAENVFGKSDPDYALSLYSIGQISMEQERYNEALTYFLEA